MNMNPMQLMQMVRGKQNPQQVVMGLLESEGQNNPMLQNLLVLANQNKTQQIESIVKNYFTSQGFNFEEEFSKFKNQFGLNS